MTLTDDFYFFRFEILVGASPKEMELCVALKDYRDDLNNICLRKEETVLVLDRLSRPGMYHVVRLHADGSRGEDMWVPSRLLQRKKSTAEIIRPAGNVFITHSSFCSIKLISLKREISSFIQLSYLKHALMTIFFLL